MAGQRQQSQNRFGNQYYPSSSNSSSSSKNRVSNNNHGQQAEAENDGYGQACSYVSQQLRAQIGDQRPAWDGPVPGFWDRKPPPPPPPPPSSSTQQQQQQKQSHAMSQQNQLRRPAAMNFGQEQQHYMDENEASHFLHAQEHIPASQLHKGGSGLGGQSGGSANRDILPSMGMQQATPGQYNRQQPYQNNNNKNTSHQSATMTMPGPNSIAPPGQQSSGTFGLGRPNNQPAAAGYAPGQYNNRTQRSYHNNDNNNRNTNHHQSANMTTMPGPNSFATPRGGQTPGSNNNLDQGRHYQRQPAGYAPPPSPSNNKAPMYYPSRTSRGTYNSTNRYNAQ